MSTVGAGFSMSLDRFVADSDDGVDLVFEWCSAGGTDVAVTIGDGHEGGPGVVTRRDGVPGVGGAVELPAKLAAVRRAF